VRGRAPEARREIEGIRFVEATREKGQLRRHRRLVWRIGGSRTVSVAETLIVAAAMVIGRVRVAIYS
jgi:hypothetical protein